MSYLRPERHSALKPHPMAVTGKAVLVIEDQPSLANMLAAALLKRIGCEVQVAHTLASATQILQTRPGHFSVAICDLNLPDAQFNEIIDTVSAHAVSIVAMTGEYSVELRDVVLKKNVVDFVLKDSFNAVSYIIDLVHRLYKNVSLKALIVDDSAASRSLLRRNLNLQNLHTMVAVDGKQALTILQANPDISLILTDYEMPGMSGVQLCNEVRKKFSKEQLSIIGMSGVTHSRLSAEFLKNGANDFILKSFSYEELLCRVNQNLDMLDLIRENYIAASRDFLTGLFNRRHFFQYGQKVLEQVKKRQGVLAVAMIDVDHFKQVNDLYGHEVGDVALIQIAQALLRHFDRDALARLGGEEFVVLLSDMSPAKVRQQLESFRIYQERNPLITLDGQSLPLRVSIGCVSLPTDSLDLNKVLQQADQNLYAAKHQGRNCLVM